MNRVVVKINNAEYVLKGEESEEYLNQIGFTVNRQIETMIKANKKLNIHDAAILTSCNLVDEKLKIESSLTESKNNEILLQTSNVSLQNEIDSLRLNEKVMHTKMNEMKMLDQSVLDDKESEIKKLQSEIKLLKESVNEYRDDNENFSKINKELKFELQSYKYKVLDLQNKLFESQTLTPRDKRKEPFDNKKIDKERVLE